MLHALLPGPERTAGARAPDTALIAAVADGDRDRPLVELYHRYGGAVYGYGLRRLHESGLAEELVQETFVRLWRNAWRYDGERGSVAAFVFGIARRSAIDLHRRSSRHAGDELPLELGGDDPALDEVLLAVTVREALAELSGEQRRMLELAYDEGLSQSQVAERLDLPLGTVKSRTWHALRRLKDELTKRGIDG